MLAVRSTLFAVMATACALLGSVPARAGAINYITNGSFESNSTTGNTSSFTGWTIGGTFGSGPGYGPEAFVTNGSTAGRYGDVVSSDNATSPDPDSNFGGNYAVYLVDDAATETLSQTLYLTPGTYEVGFDAFATASGYGNPNNATLSATIGGVSITSTNVNAMSKAVWEHYAANVTITSAGNYTYSFVYASGAAAAKDVLLDDVYVISPSTLGGTGVTIPEPSSLAVLLAPLALLMFSRRRSASAPLSLA